MKTLVRIDELEGYKPGKLYECKCGGYVAYFDKETMTGYCSSCYILGRNLWDKTRKEVISS